jgi:formylglycine-generating enzyme required for sulfatase activity
VICSPAAAHAGSKVYACKGYRLPTESEWEYAYRSGTTTALYNGAIGTATCNKISSDVNADKIGWHKAISGNTPHPVGKKDPNAWGLYDMAGNLNEWCHDWFASDLGSTSVTNPAGAGTGTEKVIRGGSWQNISKHMRAANRNKLPHYQPSPWVGFRCVRTMN